MTARKTDWTKFINERGDFQLSTYVYLLINNLMKDSLDLGTLLSDDPKKLRAFKEQIKSGHKNAWNNVADILCQFGIIQKCICEVDKYCDICRGSRFVPTAAVNSEEAVETFTFLAGDDLDENQQLSLELNSLKAQ